MQEENKTQEDKKIPEGNVHPDQSVLSENSAFYKPEDNRTTREKLQSMNFKDKIIFIVQYYGLKILAVVAAILLVLYFILHAVFQKDTVLSIMAVNAQDIMTTTAAADEQSFYDDFLTEHEIDPKDVEVAIDSSSNIVANDADSSSLESIQSIQVKLVAGTEDVMLADEEFMQSIGEMGYLADLTGYLPQEMLDRYADDILYATNVDSGDKVAVAIRLSDDNKWLADSGWFANVKGPMIGVCSSAQNLDLAEDFVKYVLGEE